MSKLTGLAKITQPVVKLTRQGMRFLSKNSNVLLTIISATGVIATVWVTITGTIKAVKLCEEKKVVGRKQVIETVWKCYIPTIGFVLLTTTAILCNGKINAKRLAVLTSAYSGSIETIKKIEEKMSEQIGPKKTQKAVDEASTEIAKEHMPKDQKDIIATGTGDQLFYLKSTGQWFYSDWNGIELAKIKIQKEIEHAQNSFDGEYYPVSRAQDILKLPATEMGQYMAWPVGQFSELHPFELIVSSDWMDLPWGRQIVGVVSFGDWPENY